MDQHSQQHEDSLDLDITVLEPGSEDDSLWIDVDLTDILSAQGVTVDA